MTRSWSIVAVPRRLRRVTAGLVLAVLSFAGFGASAAGVDEIALSRDGENWEDWDPLFDDEVRWVPGDVRQESFYVRNDGPTAAELVVEFVIDDPDGLVADEWLNLRARFAGEKWQPTVGERPDLAARSLDHGEVVRVDLEASLSSGAPNTTMRDHVSIDIRTSLSGAQALGARPEESGADPGGSGLLPTTGGTVGAIILLAALMIGGGLALVRHTRRAGSEP